MRGGILLMSPPSSPVLCKLPFFRQEYMACQTMRISPRPVLSMYESLGLDVAALRFSLDVRLGSHLLCLSTHNPGEYMQRKHSIQYAILYGG